ncbi:photosystem II assembly protein Psb34 [Cyanothece sp. BG0011]|uniref:photosystem II assembly protein Psb34 n=1 Tax=Cyanothece sp. BG0011 TaxID=2082950 RepID=UPI000D1E7088|nr:ssl1498 family light-harvesting-like protein [Cyanothece sp. BG0011]
MYTNQLDNGILNIYATEPKPYYAQYPAPYQQRKYLVQGAIATLFVAALILVSFTIS